MRHLSQLQAHFSEMLAGVSTLRAFGDVGRAIDFNTGLLATNLLTAFYQKQVHGVWPPIPCSH